MRDNFRRKNVDGVITYFHNGRKVSKEEFDKQRAAVKQRQKDILGVSVEEFKNESREERKKRMRKELEKLKKNKGGLMEATKRLKAQGLRKGGEPKQGGIGGALGRGKPKKGRRPKGKETKSNKTLTPQEKKDLLDKIKKSQGKMTNPFLKFNKLGQPYMEAKKGGSAKFPDLSGDGKVTMKDILMGRGVIKKPQKKNKGGFTGRAGIAFDADNKLRRALKSIDESDAAFKRKKNRERMIRRRKRLSGAAAGLMGAVKGVLKGAGKVAGRAAKRGYGIAKK